MRKSFLRCDCQNSSFSPPLALWIRDPGNLDHEVDDVFFEISARSHRLIGEKVERVIPVFAKKDAVRFEAGFA